MTELTSDASAHTRGDEPDGGHHDAPRERRPLQRALLTRLFRRADDGRDVADEQGPAEGEHEPGQQVVTEEHTP